MTAPSSANPGGEVASPPEELTSNRAAMTRAVINVFLMFHLLAILATCVPVQLLIVTRFKEHVRPYMLWSGLFQNWDMFSPDPPRVNIRVEAEITFLDGQTRTWKFPLMHELGYVERYFRERYRKYSTEYLRVDEYAGLRPDAARYVARLNNNDPSNPPVSVTFYRTWSEMKLMRPDGVYEEDPWTRISFFTYKVTAGDLP